VSRHKTRQRQRAEARARDLAHRTIDEVDPPVWGQPPPDATGLVIRCHELRRKRLDELTVEDLRLGIGQKIALTHLVPLAVPILRASPLAEGNYYPGDLLNAVVGVDDGFWKANPGLTADVWGILTNLAEDASRDLDADVSRDLASATERFGALVGPTV